VGSNEAVIAIMSVAFFGQGLVGLGWTVITDIAPKKAMGLAAGVFNLATNMAGIVTPLGVGFIVKATGSFVWALAMVAGLALLGAFSYLVILGDVKRVEID
jgi:ACS family D-galactonate transporter-like MFS transporter